MYKAGKSLECFLVAFSHNGCFSFTYVYCSLVSGFTHPAFAAHYLYRNSSGELIFKSTYLNEGGAYSTSTGVFTCPVAGTYFFSVSLTKARGAGVGYVYCSFKRNGSAQQYMSVDPHDDANSDNGAYMMSSTTMMKLVKGDRVSVGSCTASHFFRLDTASFTGFLVKADP